MITRAARTRLLIFADFIVAFHVFAYIFSPGDQEIKKFMEGPAHTLQIELPPYQVINDLDDLAFDYFFRIDDFFILKAVYNRKTGERVALAFFGGIWESHEYKPEIENPYQINQHPTQ